MVLSSPEGPAFVFAVSAGLVTGAVTVHVLRSGREATGVNDPGLSTPFAVATGIFALCTLTFPLYWTLLPPEAGSLITIGIATLLLVPWTVFALRYGGRGHALTTRRVLVGAALSLFFVVLLLATLLMGEQVPTIVDTVIGLSLIAVLGGVIGTCSLVIVSSYQHDGVTPGRALSLSLPPLALVVAGQLLNVDPLPESLTVASVLLFCAGSFVVAVVRYDALATRPGTSRLGVRAVVADMDEAVLVLNADERVVRTNAASDQLFDDAVGETISAVLDADLAELRDCDVFDHWTANGYRRFDPRVSTITGGGGRQVGHAVTLIDVTDREVRRQRIEVLNRVLRHNIRNELSAIDARAELATDDERPVEPHVGKIRTIAGDLEQLSASAHQIEKLIDRSGCQNDREWRLDEVVDGVLTAAVDGDADVTRSIPPISASLDRDLVDFALHNVVENTVEHTDKAEPRVEIRAERTDIGFRVTVADDGPGIPDHERQAIESGSEAALTHASSLGLWGTSWAVQTLGGTLTLGESELGGTAVALHFPIVGSE